MILYLFNIFFALTFSILAERYSKRKYITLLDEEKKIPNLFFVSIVLVCFMNVYALRWNVGTDFVSYYNKYLYYGNMDLPEIFGINSWGFYSISSIMNTVVPNNFVIYNFVLAGLTYIPVLLTIRKYSNYFTISLILYITTMSFYFGFNGVRQGIAISICFSAFPLLFKNKYFRYMLVVFIASLFHSTALLMLPMMFIITKKAWSRTVIITSLILLVSVFFLPSIWDYLINFLDFIGQDKISTNYKDFGDEGVNTLRILVAAIPVMFSFIFYKKLKSINSNIDLLINFSLFNLVFMVFGAQMIVLARISKYFSIFNILLVPEFMNIFKGKDRILFISITMILFFIYMLMLLPAQSDLLPYNFVFNL